MVNESSGSHLVVIGGAEDKKSECVILKEFVQLSHKAKARIVVMTVATDYPEEVGAEYKEVFKRLGASDVQVIDVSQRKDAQSDDYTELAKIWKGAHPEDNSELVVEDNLPEGFAPPDLAEEPQLTAPGIDPEFLKEVAMRLSL